MAHNLKKDCFIHRNLEGDSALLPAVRVIRRLCLVIIYNSKYKFTEEKLLYIAFESFHIEIPVRSVSRIFETRRYSERVNKEGRSIAARKEARKKSRENERNCARVGPTLWIFG